MRLAVRGMIADKVSEGALRYLGAFSYGNDDLFEWHGGKAPGGKNAAH